MQREDWVVLSGSALSEGQVGTSVCYPVGEEGGGPRYQNGFGVLLECGNLLRAMLPLSTKRCLKSSKLRPILNGQFCHAISKNIS